jgi:hypothetical protein
MEDHHNKDISYKVPGLLIPIHRIPMMMIMIIIMRIEEMMMMGMEMTVIISGVDIKDMKSLINS